MTDHGSSQFDAELVAAAQAGDESAVHALIAAVRAAVLRYCRFRLGSYPGGADVADDVAQETCVAVLGSLPRYTDQGAPFAAFVYAIAAHKVADAQRGFARAAVLVDEVPDRVEPSPTPEEHAVSAASMAVAGALLEQLGARTRDVLLLRAAGLSADRVGARLGMTGNAVRVAQHRGMLRLRRLVEGSPEHRELFAGYLRGPVGEPAPAAEIRALELPAVRTVTDDVGLGLAVGY